MLNQTYNATRKMDLKLNVLKSNLIVFTRKNKVKDYKVYIND